MEDKKEFSVELPLNGKIYVVVKATNEKEAIQKALENCDLVIKTESDLGYEIEEWEPCDVLIQGNFFRGVCSRASAMEL